MIAGPMREEDKPASVPIGRMSLASTHLNSRIERMSIAYSKNKDKFYFFRTVLLSNQISNHKILECCICISTGIEGKYINIKNNINYILQINLITSD